MQAFEDTCLAALRGQKAPQNITDLVVNLCTIRGIRYHPAFANESAKKWGSRFQRALNARLIMSNIIPNIDRDDDFPYCIWHPEVAAQATYAGLAQRYPQMRYQVGRACAVAHYSVLFKQLQLLPDISIADEARDSGCNEIYDSITKQEVVYAVMDDYTRSVHDNNPRQAHYLNGDAAVRSSLERKRDFRTANRSDPYSPFSDVVFNITEDYCIDEVSSSNEDYMVDLLYTPLPTNLPPGNKQLLILSAAYHGDIDRYARLRRPRAVPREYSCVIRGIYHNTMFAKYWSKQPLRSGFDDEQWSHVQRA